MNFNKQKIKSEIDKALKEFYLKVGGKYFVFVRGIDKIYEEVSKTSKEIGNILKIPDAYWGIEDEMQKREILLYTVSGYREHLIHQFNVFLAGYRIIDLITPEKLHSLLNSQNDTFDENYNIYRIWFLTALFHDIEYTIQTMGKWLPETLKRFLGINIDDEWKLIYNNHFLNWGEFYLQNYEHISAIKEHFVSSYDKPFSSSTLKKELFEDGILGEEKNHGTLSAIWLLRQDSPSDINKDQEKKARITAATAISLHTKSIVKHIKQSISFNSHPLPFLLMFCDNLCEYGRIKLDNDNSLNNSNQYTSKGSPKLKDIKIEKNKIICEIIYSFKELNCENTVDAKVKIRELVQKHVSPFQSRFEGGKEYSFEIKYYLESELISGANITF